MASKARIGNPNSVPSDYLQSIFKSENEANYAISKLIEDLHNAKSTTISYVVKHSALDKILLQLFRFLQSPIPIIVGNAAFIIGTLVEDDAGRSKIISIMSSETNKKIASLDFLVSLLGSDNIEIVMNVAGTLGTLVENTDGRNFVVSHLECFEELLTKISELLPSDYLWTSSNVALILARLSIDATGNTNIINSPVLEQLVTNLIICLTHDEAGRGMNASFALGRIFDNEETIKRFYTILSKSVFVENLVNIVDSNDLAFMKNSCFCLSSVMECNTGYELVTSNRSFGRLILLLERILLLQDDEAVWFCVLTLKAIGSRVAGCKLLKKNKNILANINTCLHNPSLSIDVKRECKEIMEFISPLAKPSLPYLTLLSPHEVHVSWTTMSPKNGFDLRYQLYYRHENEEILAYRGKKCEVTLNNLEPNTKYEFYLTISNEMETSENSDICLITTDEDYPSEPCNLSVITTTATQIKIGWDSPEFPNGVIKYYDIHLNNGSIEQTTDRVSIISGLQPETKYSISVFAVNSCGKSQSVGIDVYTRDAGAHAPSKPTAVVLGRSEIHLSWLPPDSPMGKIFHYDVRLNRRKIIYSGINTYCKVLGLKPDTEYYFSIVAVTNLGKFESPITTKRTMRDEYCSPRRVPLYVIPQKSDMGDTVPVIKSRASSLVCDQKLTDIASTTRDNRRRGSEYGPRKLSNVPRKGLLPIIGTVNRSISSSTDSTKTSLLSPKIKPTHRTKDLLSLQPPAQINDSLSTFSDRSTSTINPVFANVYSRSK